MLKIIPLIDDALKERIGDLRSVDEAVHRANGSMECRMRTGT